MVIAEYLRDPRFAKAFEDRSEQVGEDRQSRALQVRRLETIENDYAEGLTNGTAFKKANLKVQKNIEEIDKRLSAAMRRSVTSPVSNAENPIEAFRKASIDVQRAVLNTLIRVEIGPAPYRGSRWSPDRVKITPAD